MPKNKQKVNVLKVININGPTYDCECCGCYSSEGIDILFNDKLIWRKYDDGHMYSSQTEDTILNSVMTAWNEQVVKSIEEQHTEEARHEWNRMCPGNSVAATPQNWANQKNGMLNYQKQTIEHIIQCCERLPYDSLLQLKMIALWIEENTGEKIKIVQENFREKR